MLVIMFGQPEIHSGNLKSLPRLPKWRTQILTSVDLCKVYIYVRLKLHGLSPVRRTKCPVWPKKLSHGL